MSIEGVELVEFLKDWQTLTAGFVAFFGALITTVVLVVQHRFDKKKHREDQRKNAFYMRSLMPDALSELVSYSKACFRHVNDEDSLPAKPDKAISILKENIKYTDAKTSKCLFDIVSFYQVHNSRLESYADSIAMHKYEHILYDMTLLYHYSCCLFSYARNEVKSIKKIDPSEKDIMNAAKAMMDIDLYLDHPEHYDRLTDLVKRRWAEKYSNSNFQ